MVSKKRSRSQNILKSDLRKFNLIYNIFYLVVQWFIAFQIYLIDEYKELVILSQVDKFLKTYTVFYSIVNKKMNCKKKKFRGF